MRACTGRRRRRLTEICTLDLRPWPTRTHCCRHKCFPVCPRAQHLLRTQKMLLILFRNILCPQQIFPSLRSPGNITSNDMSATMCRRLPVPYSINFFFFFGSFTVLARDLADAIQRAQKYPLHKNKHGINTAVILFAQCPRYLYYFSSQMNTMY